MEGQNLDYIGNSTKKRFTSREIWRAGICDQSQLQSILKRKVNNQEFFMDQVRGENDLYERRKFTFKQVMLIYLYQHYLKKFNIRANLLKKIMEMDHPDFIFRPIKVCPIFPKIYLVIQGPELKLFIARDLADEDVADIQLTLDLTKINKEVCELLWPYD